MTRTTAALVTAVLATMVLAVAPGAGASDGQKKWGDFFKKPTGGDICFDGDGSVIACAPPDSDSSGSGSGTDGGSTGSGTDAGLMKKQAAHGDSWFCNLCHVNPTNEVAGPRALRDAVMADAGLFWRRHDTIAARVVNKGVLTPVRDTRTVSSALQRLMAARPRR